MSLKSKILKNYWGKLAVSYLHCAKSFLVPKLISDEKAVKKYYKKWTGKDIDLEHPQTFCEKLNWYKLYNRNPLMAKCADKVDVREYVRSKGYADTLNELYGVYDKVSEIDADALPERFVLKAAHGSHMNYIVKDKSSFDWKSAKRMMRSWLRQNIYWSGREWVYKDLPKRIIAEKYLEDESGELRDYKLFCFQGKAQAMQVDFGRYSGQHYRNFYDMTTFELFYAYDSDRLPHLEHTEGIISREQFKTLKKIAEDLAEPFEQVRVDFYLVKGKVFFGEMTFFDGGGSTIWEPDKYNYIIGESWQPKRKE